MPEREPSLINHLQQKAKEERRGIALTPQNIQAVAERTADGKVPALMQDHIERGGTVLIDYTGGVTVLPPGTHL